ncbi:MAG: type II secretion system protein [Proteobacteria bacterium]|nr:type II secretion system protein [Pseudomonadota bacterium]
MTGFNLKNGGGSDCWLPGISKQHGLNNKKGFTLLEIMAVLVIMGTMFSITVKKFDLISDTASLTALKVGVRELNIRETMVWTQIKLSDDGWSNDDEVFDAVDKNTGRGYSWNPVPDVSGGTLHYKSQSADLDRKVSTNRSVGSWK